MQACGIVLKKDKSCILTLSSAEGDDWFGHNIQRNKNYVETHVHKAFIYVKSITKETCLLKMIINADPHLDYIP